MTAVDWVLLTSAAGLGIWAILSLLRHLIRLIICIVGIAVIGLTLIVLYENGWLPETVAELVSESIAIRWCTENVMPGMDALIELIRTAIPEHDQSIDEDLKGQHL